MMLTALLLLTALSQSPAPAALFDYDASRPLDVKETSRREDTGVVLRDITYATLGGGTNAATLITPTTPAPQPAPAILFVHWYGPPAPTSNRTQFIPDGIALVLLAQPGIDRTRVAYVGHDFGTMYGTIAAAVDPRVTQFVFMAGTASFSDWFLYGPKMEGEARDRFIAQLAPLDPVKWVSKLRGPVLMQFADNDEHVSTARRELLTAAAARGADVRVYQAGHELSEESTRERLAWLRKVLRI